MQSGTPARKDSKKFPQALLLWVLLPTWSEGIFSFLSQSMDLKISQKILAKILKCYTELQVIFRENTSKTNTDPSLEFVSHYPWAPRLHNTPWPQGTYCALISSLESNYTSVQKDALIYHQRSLPSSLFLVSTWSVKSRILQNKYSFMQKSGRSECSLIKAGRERTLRKGCKGCLWPVSRIQGTHQGVHWHPLVNVLEVCMSAWP